MCIYCHLGNDFLMHTIPFFPLTLNPILPGMDGCHIATTGVNVRIQISTTLDHAPTLGLVCLVDIFLYSY